MGSEFIGREPSPDSELLPGSDRIVPALNQQWTICTSRLGRLDCLFSDYPIWQVFGEEGLGDSLTGHFSHPFDG